MFTRAGRSLRAIHSSWSAVDLAALVIRVALGIAFVAHGGQKLFGWFGGTGITGTTAFFDGVGIPAPHAFAYIVGLTEFCGGLLILAGAFTLVATLALLTDMIVAIATVSHSAGFFVTAQKIGWELNLYLVGLIVAMLIIGPGGWSVDAALGLTRRPWRAAATAPADPAQADGAGVGVIARR